MAYLAAAIVILAISIVVASVRLSNAVESAARMVMSALADSPQNHMSPGTANLSFTSMTPDQPPHIGGSSSMDDVADARLEIQKRVFDTAPLRAMVGQVSEKIGDQDIVGISNGISERGER